MTRALAVIVALGALAGAFFFVEETKPAWYARMRYPLEYQHIVVGHAKNYDLDPALLAAVIYRESKFDANARSSSGAVGLMQLLPETAKGIAVHSANCPNVKNLLFNPDREIEVSWDGERKSSFQIDLQIRMEDRQGILAKILASVANLKTNVQRMESRTADGKATAELIVEISDLKHLEKVIRSISSVEGVIEVERKYNIRHAVAQ